MSSPLSLDIRDSIAVITMDSPPVNGLGHPLREGLMKAYQQATNDNAVKAIVIASAGKLFCGGADITEFGSPLANAEPSLPTLLNLMEESSKPIVAAINGFALGGGFELALACDYRIALPSAKIGLPEVKLGILPGAGGTQRLPRVAGVKFSLEMITSGKPMAAAKALAAGAIDRLHEGEDDFLEAAISYAKELLDNKAPVRSCANMAVDLDGIDAAYFADFRKSIARANRGLIAAEHCVQAVEAACELSLENGLKKERELFSTCVNSYQSRSQRHLFFAERAATKIPGVDPKTPLRKIAKVAIIGSGTMGGGIAMNFINAGIPTTILDLNGEALERGVGVIRKNYEISAKKGRLSDAQVEERMGLLQQTTSYDDIADVDLVIEAVFENMEIKKTVFKTLDEVCKPGAILASNTSTLDVDEIAAATKRPHDVIGLHFFSPANVMRLLEIVRGEKTTDDALLTTVKIAQAIGKVPVVVGVCFGFVGNRMLEPYGREASRLLLEGASPAQIDRALTQFGMAMGFCSMIDLAGVDVGYLTRQGNLDAISHDPSYAALGDALYELGRYGQKTGRGHYIYEGREQKEDEDLARLSTELAAKLGIERREISDQEIVERTIYTMINEGAQILDEGIASRSSDCDLVYTNGYGFPIGRGGPMQFADETGLDVILERMQHYHDTLGEHGKMWFKPAALLEKLVAEKQKFSHYVPSTK